MPHGVVPGQRSKGDNMLTNFLDHKLGKKYNTFDLLVLFLIIAMTLMLRLWFIDLQFPDYTICLKPWVR